MKASHCEGSVGIMTVKQTVDGIYLYFAHNTDSFVSAGIFSALWSIANGGLLQVLANMSSDDKKPSSVMSRGNGHGSIAQGGKAFRMKQPS